MAEVAREQGGARPQMLTAKEMLDADVLRGIAINRRLALAALRLAVLAAATHRVMWWTGAFHVAAKWAGAESGEEATRPINDAIDEVVEALREAGEVSE